MRVAWRKCILYDIKKKDDEVHNECNVYNIMIRSIRTYYRDCSTSTSWYAIGGVEESLPCKRD